MKEKLVVSLNSLVSLEVFSMFPEYFFSISMLYAVIAVIVATYNTYGLILQKALSEFLALVLFLTGYLIFNDDLLVLNFLNFNNSILSDQFAFFIRILICVFSAFYFLIVASCLKEQKIISFEYTLIILLAVLGLLLMCNSNDFLITYLAIELATLAFYLLASFYKTSNSSVDSAVKYFIIGAVSSAFFLLGSSFIYGFTGSINFSEFSVLIGNKFDWVYFNHKDYINYIGVLDHKFLVFATNKVSVADVNVDFFYKIYKKAFQKLFSKTIFKPMNSVFDLKLEYKLTSFFDLLENKASSAMIFQMKEELSGSKFNSNSTSPCGNIAAQMARLTQIKDCSCLDVSKPIKSLDLLANKPIKTLDLLANKSEAYFTIKNAGLRRYLSVFNEPVCFVGHFFGNSFIEFGLILILFSLFIKLALAPFHVWSLDVYEGVPISSAFFFAVLTKLSLFVLLIRLCCYSFIILNSCWQFYFLAFGLLSIFVGSFGGLTEKRLKTLLAYSSISHMGYALVAFSTGTFIGIQMLLLYIVVYMLSGLALWYVLVLLVLKKPKVEDKDSKELSDLAQLKKSNLMLATVLSLSAFSTAGIPPLIGFFAKLNVFLALVGDFFYGVSLGGVLCSVISTFYYIRIVKVLHFENVLAGKLYFQISTIKTLILSVVNFLQLLLFVSPNLFILTS